MKNRFNPVIVLLVLLVTFTNNVRATPSAKVDQNALIYVQLDSPGSLSLFTATGLPMYAEIGGGLLSGADPAEQLKLNETGLSFRVPILPWDPVVITWLRPIPAALLPISHNMARCCSVYRMAYY